ncbi:ribosome silencing factor [Candidatus Dependentiae bacterium]|nr:ribosome silencing factor [Candidatus Dependentiae bacterium]
MVTSKKKEKISSEDISTDKLMEKVVRILDDKHGIDITIINVSSMTSLCRYFVICSGESRVQLRAMAEELQYRLKHDDKLLPISLEGYPDSGWILLDYFDIIIHLFDLELRDFYRLERLWGQGEFKELEEIIPELKERQ